jgi:hypothetical protein
MFFDFDTTALFGSATQELCHYTSRILHSNNVKQVTQYINEKHALLTNCNAFERGEQLTRSGNRHRFAERLDADVLQASLTAERRINKFKDPSLTAERRIKRAPHGHWN